jgi:hypothetical protein
LHDCQEHSENSSQHSITVTQELIQHFDVSRPPMSLSRAEMALSSVDMELSKVEESLDRFEAVWIKYAKIGLKCIR